MSDFGLALLFWLLYEVLSLPLRLALAPLRMTRDVRRIVSRLAGPAALALIAGFAAHAGVPLGRASGWTIFSAAALGSALFFRYGRAPHSTRDFLDALSPVSFRRWRRDLTLEVGGLILFLSYVAFRRLAPEMTFEIQNSGAEKFPNAMLFWSCWHAKTLPPVDYWLAGHPQAYYYWGHFFWAWIGRLGGFPAETVIALALSRVFLLVAESGYLLLRAFRLRWKAAALGALFISLGGDPQSWLTLKQQYERHHPHGAYELVAVDGGPDVKPQNESLTDSLARRLGVARWDLSAYSFWEPSRVIPGTVNEFPIWSAILGDFHAHHLALPWFLGWLAMMLGGDRWSRDSRSTASVGLWVGITAAVAVAACLSNLWNVPLVASGLIVLSMFGLTRGPGRVVVATTVCWMAFLGAALYLDGVRPLAPLASGSVAGGGTGTHAAGLPIEWLPRGLRSTGTALFLLWGTQMVLLLVAAIGRMTDRRGRALAACCFAGAALAGLAGFLPALGIPGFRTESEFYWIAMGFVVAGLASGRRPRLGREGAIAGLAACLLLAGLEVFYVRDRMTGELVRYNSYFKFSYPAWPILSAVAWSGSVRAWRASRGIAARSILGIVMLAVCASSAGTVLLSVPARILQARIGDDGKRAPTLNAFSWLKCRTEYRAEAQALDWIREHVPVGAAVAEAATGSAYGYAGRVASLSGHPIPLGWAHHEAQWRGPVVYDTLAEVQDQVRSLYLSADVPTLRRRADRLGIQWIILGLSEARTYGPEVFDAARNVLGAAGTLAAKFPSQSPSVYIFKLEAEGRMPDPGSNLEGERAP